MTDAKKQEVVNFIRQRIDAILEWYVRGDAVDCPETRKNINKDLDSILPEAEKKFGLKKIQGVLRVRSSATPGVFKVRLEKPDLV